MDAHDSRELENLKSKKRKAEAADKVEKIAELSNDIGALYIKNERYEEALEEFQAVLHMQSALGDKIKQAVACRMIGECLCGLDRFEEALKKEMRHLSLARECQNVVEEQRALATIGRTYFCQAETLRVKKEKSESLKKAKDVFKQSLKVCDRLKQSTPEKDLMEMQAGLFLNLGLVVDGEGDLESCSSYMKKAIDISRNAKLDEIYLYRCRIFFAGVHMRNRNYAPALRYLEEACVSAKKMKNKHFEADILLQKAMIHLQEEDFKTARHLMKKAKKCGLPTEEETSRLKQCYKSACKMEKVSKELKNVPKGDNSGRIQLCEKMADSAADAGNFNQSIKYYTQMLTHSKAAGKRDKELISVYVSLAQTYKDDRQYDQAIHFYQEEMKCRGSSEADQICRTWLNIAEAQELDGQSYVVCSSSYQRAYNTAREAKLRKLQVQSLRSLIELQKIFKQEKHLEQTQTKLQEILTKFNLSEAELEEDSQDVAGQDDDDDEEESEDDDVSMSDLTDSDEETRVTMKKNEKGETQLHLACIHGNLKKVKELIRKGHPVNPRDFSGWTPLHEAANHGFHEVVEFLLDSGAAINDRGGKHCGGVTPLIDAANNGNLIIMRLLIERGADVLAKDDQKQTALDCLRERRRGCTDGELTPDEIACFESVEELLTDRMPNYRGNRVAGKSKGQNGTALSSQAAPVVRRQSPQSEDLPTISRTKRMRPQQRKSRNAIITESDSDDSPCPSPLRSSRRKAQIEDPVESDTAEDVYQNAYLERVPTPVATATDAYRQAMDEVGSSASRITGSQAVSVSPRRRSSGRVEPALVSVGEESGDGWLIDDLPPRKRRKMGNKELFYSDSSKNGRRRSGGTPRHRTDPQRKRRVSEGEISVQTESSSSDGENTRPEPFEPESREVGLEISTETPSVDADDSDALFVISDPVPLISSVRNFDRTTSSAYEISNSYSNFNNSNNNNKTRVKQHKITDFTVRPEGENSLIVPGQTDVASVSSASQRVEFGTSAVPAATSSMTTGVTAESGMLLRVSIKDKTLWVPVQNSGGLKTISWLAMEAAQRYYKLYGLKPILTLSKDGAFFSPDDPVDLVLQGTEKNTQIEATVESWELPPLEDCYTEACKALNTVMYKNIKTLLTRCESTGSLWLKELALRPHHFQPILRAVQCQTSVRELHLQSNRIGDMGVESLCKVLPTVPNLTCLNIACNDVTPVGLAHLSSALTSDVTVAGQTKPLQNLTSLDLSNNTLGDGTISQLITIVTELPQLTHLGLSACHFTVKLFQQHRVQLSDALHASPLQSLDVSFNSFGCVGVELLLKCLNAGRMTILNLSSCVSTPSGHMSRHIHSFVTQENCCLNELQLNDCHLSVDDSDFIIRFPEARKSLQKLSLSRNLKLDNAVLCQLLQTSARVDGGLEEVDFVGCGVRSPLNTDFLDALSEKLLSPTPLRRLHLTCQGLEKVDVQCITQIWTEKWQDTAVVVTEGQLVKLSVADQQ